MTFKKVHPGFGILIMLLLGINFLQFGGVEGTNCFNYYAGIYVIVMLYSGRKLYILISLQLLLLAVLTYLIFTNHSFYQLVLIGIDSESSIEFVYSLVSIAVFTFYLKSLTISEISNHGVKITEVRLKVRESKNLNQEMIMKASLS